MNLVVIMHLVLLHKIDKYMMNAVMRLLIIFVLKITRLMERFSCMVKLLQERHIQC